MINIRRNLLVWGGGVTLALLGVAVTTSATLGRAMPDTALAIWPVSAVAAARKAELLSISDNPQDVAAAGRLARRALLRQPLDVTAARTLSTVAAKSGRLGDSETMLTLAEWISRRDAPTQITLIEARVARGDVAGALIHYDRAMRTDVTTRPLLLPVLVKAADDPAVGRDLAAILHDRPWWWQDFFDRYSQSAENPASLEKISNALRFNPSDSSDAERLSVAINRLVGLGDIDRARNLYATVRSAAQVNATLRDGNFENDAPLAPFEWTYVANDDRAGIREYREGAAGKVALSLTGTSAGIVARQLLTLQPGKFVITARIGNIPGDEAARPAVTISCAGSGPSGDVLLTVALPATGNMGAWKTLFTVPKTCRSQWLTINTGANVDAANSTPWIDDLHISPTS